MAGRNEGLEPDNEYLNDLKSQAESLLRSIDKGDHAGTMQLIQDLKDVRDKSVYMEVGRLTRALHNAIVNFHVDIDISQQKEGEISNIKDASSRLNYVTELTAEAANKTMDMVDESAPVINEMEQEAAELQEQWKKLQRKELNASEFRALSKRVESFLDHTVKSTGFISSRFTEILTAQGYQDLSGQVIKRVITLVQDVERDLVELVRMASHVEQVTGVVHNTSIYSEAAQAVKIEPEGPAVHADKRDDVVSGQDEVDDLLSSLGF